MKIVYTLALLLVSISSIYGQCDNNVSTDPLNPTNNNLPINPNNYGDKFLNQFDWNERTINGTLATYPLQNMQYNQNMQNVMSNQAIEYYNYIAGGEKMLPIHGWELLLLNIGKYPNLEDFPLPDGFTDIPYIVLYNRYSGIVRVFANYGNGFLPNGINFDAIRIDLKYKNENVNGLLRLNQGFDQALDQTSNVIRVTSIAKHPNSPGKWFSTDFQVAYDPCVCYHPSNMRLNFIFIKGEDIVLQGRQIDIESDIIDGYEVFGKDFLTNFDVSEIDNSEKGSIIMYQAMDFLVEDYIAKTQAYKDKLELANEHNKQVDFNLAVVKLFNTIALQGGSKLISAYIFDPIYENLVDEMTSKSIFKQDSVRLDKLEEYTLKAFTSGVGKLNTFVAKNFKKMDNPSKPVRPSATFSEMVIKGSISDTISIGGPNFYTPGSYGSPGTPVVNLDSYFEYPIYNDVLGVFALLESPKILISKNVKDEFNKSDQRWFTTNIQISETEVNYEIGVSAGLYQNWTKSYQIQLVNDLKYSFNSVLDIKGEPVINASWKIHAKNKALANTSNSSNPVKKYYCFNDPAYIANLTSPSINVENYDNINVHGNPSTMDNFLYSNGSNHIKFLAINKEYSNDAYLPNENSNLKDEVIFESPSFAINSFHNNVYAFGLKNEYISKRKTIIGYRTNAISSSESPLNPTPFGGFPDFSSVNFQQPSLISGDDYGYDYDLEVELKLIIDVQFNTLREDDTPNSATYILTYKIRPEDTDSDPNTPGVQWLTTDIYPNLKGSSADITQYPENLSFKDHVFDGTAITGCRLENNHYTCQAWDDITINGNLTTANGYTVDIFAGNELIQIPESSVSPEIVLDIKPILDYSHPMPQADQTYVSNFCQGLNPNAPSYKGNQPSAMILAQIVAQDSLKSLMQNQTITEKPFDFTLYPNPTSNQTRVAMQNNDPRSTKIYLTDITGKKLSVQLTTVSDNVVSFDVQNLEKGVYFVTVKTNYQQKTKQLVVN